MNRQPLESKSPLAGTRIIAGSGRSGTTWILDALAEVNDLRPVFEPLHPAVSKIGDRYAYRTLTSDDAEPELERFLTDVINGRRHTLWTQYRLPGDRLMPHWRHVRTLAAAKREWRRWRKFLGERSTLATSARRTVPLVKCIRANLMLPWLVERCACPAVLVLRHPGAVVESQLRLGQGDAWDPEPVLERYRHDQRLHEQTGNRYRRLLTSPLARVEALTLAWVIENQWPVERAPSTGATVALYERLRGAGDLEWLRIVRALGLARVPTDALLARPSQQASRDTKSATTQSAAPRWQQSLTTGQLKSIQRILDETGFDLYDTRNAVPHEHVSSVANAKDAGRES
jgi:hypothetical protein